MNTLGDYIYYDEKGNLRFEHEINKKLALPIKWGIGIDYIKTIMLALSIILPLKIVYLAMKRYEFVFTDVQVDISLFLVIVVTTWFIRGYLREINSLFGVKNAKPGEARVEMREIFEDIESYNEFRDRILDKFYLRDKLDKASLTLAILLFSYYVINDAITRYRIRGGDWYYTIFGILPTGISPPPHLVLIPIIGLVGWIIATYAVFFYLSKTLWLLFSLGNVKNYGEKSYISFVSKSDFGSFVRFEEARYLPIWRVSNYVSKISLKVAVFILLIDIVYGVIVYIYPLIYRSRGAVFSMEVWIVQMLITYIFIGIAILIFVLPFFGFYKILSNLKANIGGHLFNIYERKIFLYFSTNLDVKEKAKLSSEILTLQETIDYYRELPVWPFTVPQLIRIVGFGSISAVLPHIYRFFVGG